MGDKIKHTEQEWKQKLTDDQYSVCRQKGTELAFTGKYYNCKDNGIYKCSCCGQPLFSSETKFDSGTGWPSFYAPLDDHCVASDTDNGHGMRRVEVLCSKCDAHLGHVFDDGPAPTHQRYCINSVSLKLDKS